MFGDKLQQQEQVTIGLQCADCGSYVKSDAKHVCKQTIQEVQESTVWQENQKAEKPQN
jgi:hypothetical protein